MKNEIGRKLTSLTIMAIMFAGGMTVAAPSFMPGVFADFSETSGQLSVSSVYIQGGAILEVVINDPDFSDTDNDVGSGPTVTIDGNSYATNQAANGKWYVYAVDDSASTLIDADGKGMEYGFQCTTGLGVNTGNHVKPGVGNFVYGSPNIIGDETYDVWAEAVDRLPAAGEGNESGTSATLAGSCLNINNMQGTFDDDYGSDGIRQTLSSSVLQGAPSLSNWNGQSGNSTTVDLGQRGHSLNASGYGSWPYILAFEFSAENTVEYGSDSIVVEYGNTDDQTAISLLNQSPADETHLYLSITDPALNIDPTTADAWIFNLYSGDDSASQVAFASNATDTNGINISGADDSAFLSLAEMGEYGFSSNGRLANSTDAAISIIGPEPRFIKMVENDDNSGVFESWSGNGTSQLVTLDEVGGDKRVVFTYGGNSVDMIITYNAASLSFEDDNGGNWVAGESASVTVSDPDQNKYLSLIHI